MTTATLKDTHSIAKVLDELGLTGVMNGAGTGEKMDQHIR